MVAFHSGLNYLIDYLSGEKEVLNQYIPEEVMYNKRTCKNTFRLQKEIFQRELEEKLEEQSKEFSSKAFKQQQKFEKAIEKEAEKKLAAKIEQELEKKTEQEWEARIKKEKKELRKIVEKEVETEREQERKNAQNTIKQIKENAKQSIENMRQRLVLQDIQFMEDSEIQQDLESYQKLRESLKTMTIQCLSLQKECNDLLHSKKGAKRPATKKGRIIRKIVVATDSFKGCLPSMEVEEAVAEGIHKCLPDCEVTCLPMSDGGEGIQRILTECTQGQTVSLSVHDPLMRTCEASYGTSKDGKFAFIETAAASGLSLLPAELRNPLLTSSYGTGELICDALNRGCRNFIIGLGGSATNDAGTGMLQALGFKFMDKEQKELKQPLCGALLGEIESIDDSCVHPELRKANFMGVYDVEAPFYGPQGASAVFAPQKGADQEMVEALENNMRKMAEVLQRHAFINLSGIPGTGAAGGIGGSMLVLLKAQLTSGIQLVMDMLQLRNKIKDADLIITGEGKSDLQTLMGKVPSGILQEAKQREIPVILLSGAIENIENLNEAGFRGVFSITPSPVSLEQAMEPEFARENIRRTAEQICRIFHH